MVRSDRWIREMCSHHNMISPFCENLHTEGVLSYGLSAAGYDIRVTNVFWVFTSVGMTMVDPKNFNEDAFVEVKNNVCIVPPNSFLLASSLEYIKMPEDHMALVKPKSTYIRCGLLTPSTVLEPGWEGHITLEIANISPLPAKIYAYEGIAQLMFFPTDQTPDVTYGKRHGKYQSQTGITLPKV